MKELDELITYIENDLIGKHKDIEIIDEAIKKYAELYHKKQLELYGVSQQRELLIGFQLWEQYASNKGLTIEDYADHYLKQKAINCG